MRILSAIASGLFFILMAAACEGGNGPVANVPSDDPASAYYPGAEGSVFVYSLEESRDNSGIFEEKGERRSVIAGSVNHSGTNYLRQLNIFTGEDETADTSATGFRKTGAGIYTLVDTTGFYLFIRSLPDSVKDMISFDVDDEMIIFSSPLNVRKVWTAFKFDLVYPLYSYRFSLIEAAAIYIGKENVTVPYLKEKTPAEKISYTLTIRIPEGSDFTNLSVTEYRGTAWYAKDIGLVKYEGASLIHKAFTGGALNLADTSLTVREVMTSYDL